MVMALSIPNVWTLFVLSMTPRAAPRERSPNRRSLNVVATATVAPRHSMADS